MVVIQLRRRYHLVTRSHDHSVAKTASRLSPPSKRPARKAQKYMDGAHSG